MNWMFVSPRNSYIEILAHDVMVWEGHALEGD